MKRLIGLWFGLSLFALPLFAQSVPTLTNLDPLSGVQGSTLTVVLTGTNFSSESLVTVTGSGVVVASLKVISATEIDALLVLNGGPGNYSVRVVNSGMNSTARTFTVSASPFTSASELDVTSYAGPEGGAGYVDGPAATSRYSSPRGIWSDGTFIYVADTGNSVIRRIKAATGESTTIAGTVGVRAAGDGTGSAARFWAPYGIWGTTDALYITDIGTYTIRKLDLATSTVTTIAGTAYTPGNTDGTFAKFVGPTGIWGDANNLYIADTFTNSARALRKITLATGNVTTVADLGAAPFVGLSFVTGFPIDGVGLWGDGSALYIADSSREIIRKVILATGIITTLAGTDGRTGSQDSVGTSASFNSPSALWGVGTTLYVADTVNQTIRSVNTQSGLVVTLTGATGIPGWADGIKISVRFGYPSGIWANGSVIYVSESRNSAIRRVNPINGDAATLSGLPAPANAVDGSLTSARFAVPLGIWGDAHNLYVTDFLNFSIRKIALDTGQVSTFAGSSRFFGFMDNSGAAAQFGFPLGIWGDGVSLYVTDLYWDTIRKIDIASRAVTTIAGNARDLPGSRDGIGTASLFRSPSGIWGDGLNLYIVDSGNYTIRKMVLATKEVTTFAGMTNNRGANDSSSGATFYSPQDIWGDGTNLYVLDGNGVRKIVIATREVTTFAGTVTRSGYVDGKAALFNGPLGIWGDGTNLLIADTGNNVVRKIDISTGVVSTLAGSETGAGSEDGRGSGARFNLPGDLWGSGDTAYILDSWNQKIRKATAQVVTTPPNPADITYAISNRGGLSRNTAGSEADVRVGYARLIPSPGNTAPAGIAIFGVAKDGVLVSEAAVPASPLISSGRIYAEVAGAVNTGVAITNPNNQPVTLSFYFTDAAGTNANAGTTVIPANGQISAFLNEGPFASAGFQPSLVDMRSFTFSSTLPISAVALRGFTNERSQFLITTLPIVPLDSTGTTPLSFPHYADGGGWTTNVILVNPTDSILTGTVQFLSKGDSATAGSAVRLTVNGTSGSSFNYSIPARSAFKFQTANPDGETLAGSVRVTPSGGTRTPSGLVVFSFRNNGVIVSEAGVQALAAASAQRLYAEALGDFNSGAPGSIQTGFAISNSSDANVTVNLELTNLAGVATAQTGTVTVPANGQISMFLNQVQGFAGLQTPFKGTLRVSGATVSVVGLRARYNEAGSFLITTTSPVDESSGAGGAQLVFPHFVDGGGYTTQFILFSSVPNQSPAGALRFYAQSGQGLNVQFR